MSRKIQRNVVKILSAVFAICLLFSCCACTARGDNKTYVSKTYLMMDTVIEIKLRCDADRAEPIFGQCEEIMSQVEKTLSRTVEDSVIATFNRTGEVNLDAESAALIARALEISARTDGAFDPTVGSFVLLWERCGEENRLPTGEEMHEALACVGVDRLLLSEKGMRRADPDIAVTIDLGAIGKGYAIDLVLTYLNSTEIPGGVISFGGNVAVFGSKESGEPYRIGIRDPQNTAGVIGYLNMAAGVISVSGDYERYVTIDGVRYHHILNTETGYPVENGLRSVAVLCENGALADALSTALFVMGIEDAMAFYRAGIYDFEAVFVTDSEILLTDGLASAGDFSPAADGYTLSGGAA